MKLVYSDFTVATLEDELRVDALSRELLLVFYQERLAAGLDEQAATQLASSADYFVRDYLIGGRQLNLLDVGATLVRQFAGNWYIVNTLEPNASELAVHLRGVEEFCRFLAGNGAITDGTAEAIAAACRDQEYYRHRIESFLNIQGDGYFAWEKECSLRHG